ncbi:hypothetical protein WICMUC_005636 [Wickerhamomyces mucosus]|uniref:Vacuolar protein sorting-associated protein 35 n=1 Tax=Wickerhamomyces mucosus TaxID=1378264 RepID=A0A9P8P836_9ASCO|nr:hypothetical protein WICMUC_005636 [Wickerhamomyces mucosus]
MTETTISPEEQNQLLQDSIKVIQRETNAMRKCLESKGRLMDALKHASNFLTELRASQLTPKQYYELYIIVYDSLNLLAQFLKDNHPHHHLSDLYELVQYAGNIVPRLYLMITVGTVYMTIPDAPVKEIMKDMIEMCRGVQYPIRGLFLRYYLSQRTKTILPQENLDSIQFIITNFIEMNKLWVRLQHQGPSREKDKRLKEREELKILVGSNLVRISQLENYDFEYYKTDILPTIIEQIIQCKDVLAQEYLLDVIIQVFPDEFHLKTLDELLQCIKKLNPAVDYKKIFINLIDRLTNFIKREEITELSDIADFNLFDKLWDYIKEFELINEFQVYELNLLLESITKLSLIFYPKKYENIDLVLRFAIEKAKELELDEQKENFSSLLLMPVDNLSKPSKILKLQNFSELLNLQPAKVNKQLSLIILDRLLSQNFRISNLQTLNGLFSLFKIIINDKNNDNNANYANEQEKIGKLIHLISNKKDVTIHSKLLTQAKNFLNGGNIKFTYPSIFFNTLKLIRFNPESQIVNSLFKFMSRLINELFRIGLIELSFKLHLAGAQLSDQIKLEEISYEFFAQCFTVYEESISDSRLQYQSIVSIIGVLQQTRNFTRENYDTLITKTALYGSKLLKKPDQCRSVYFASHLWWGVEIPALGEEEGISEFYRDGKRVLECLQRALRVADACMDSVVSIELFIEILNRCLYYFIHGNENITVKYINGLIELIQTNVDSLAEENNTNLELPKKHFLRTLDYINTQKEIDERFQLISR